MKKLVLLFIIFFPLYSWSQYSDIGIRVSKFNSGIVSKIALGGCDQNDTGPWGMEGFLARSYVANWGYLFNFSFFKNWYLTKASRGSEVYLISKAGINLASYRSYYYINKNYTGFVYYDGKYTSNIGLTSHLGVEWISSDYPISMEMTVNPWYDFQNIGPEFIDYNFTIKYQIVQLY